MQNNPREILKSALNLWWLRPENGVGIAYYIYRGVDLRTKEGERSADFACGDGVNTFLKCGGRFDDDFDVFHSGINRASAKEVIEKKVDVFDYYDEEYAPVIVKPADCKYTYGTDHKANLLKKAQKLDFYDNVIVADLQDETNIEDESLDFVYCNSIYWVADSANALKHQYKKLKPGGKIVLDLSTLHLKKLYFEHKFPILDSSWHDLMNRGRNNTAVGLKSEEQWEDVFKELGLKVLDKRDIFPSAIAEFWNYGLRPIFPTLNKMANELNEQTRKEIKQEWVETWTDMLLPLLTNPEEFSKDKTSYRVQYVLEK